MATHFPASAIAEGMRWGQYLGDQWQREFPTEIHERSALAADGTLRWTAAFASWITNAPDHEGRQRTTQVMRKLRRVAPRAYEVLYQAMILGSSFEEITEWLNTRAERIGIELPPGRTKHYRVKDSVALFLSGVSFARAHY